VDFIEQHKAENLTDARYGLQLIQSVGGMLLGSLPDGEFHIPQQFIVGRNE
jgi:hypothetical protein